MATGSFILPPLRGYVPGGELDVQYDLARKALALEIPMWEGCDVPHMTSRVMPGASFTWVRAEKIGDQEPRWNEAFPGQGGAPKSGHIAQRVWAAKENVLGGGGWRWEDIWDVPISQFIIERNFAILMVGQPMVYMGPGLPPLSRGDAFRDLLAFKNAADVDLHRIALNYQTEQIKWRFLAAQGNASPILPFYGLRVAMLFVCGDEGGAAASPRVFIGYDNGEVRRADFAITSFSMANTTHMEMFANSLTGMKLLEIAGGCWEYFGYFIRSFEEDGARALCRDALGLVKWDPYVVRRVGWRRRVAQLTAQASVYGRVSANPAGWPRITAAPTSFPRVSATARGTGPRVTAEPTTYQRISARVRIADKEADVQATPLCPSEMNWMADNVLALSEVLDDMQVPPDPITSADSVTVEIWDRDTDTELTVVSPVTLSQVGATNAWRDSVLVNESNGFAEKQRLVLIFIFDGGVGLQGRFYALAVVAAATS